MSNNQYTKKQRDYIKKLRADGYTWAQVAKNYNAAYGDNKTHDALRFALRGEAPAPKPSIPAREKRRIDSAEKKVNLTDREYNCVMFIPDLHVPYHHKQAFEFLELVRDTYSPDLVINAGDEVDKHAMSFHDSDPDLPSAGDELEEAIAYLEDLYSLFPEMHLVDSNHGSMHYRKGKHHGIPRKYLRDYGDILEAPVGWSWSHELNVNCGGNMVRVKHQFGKNILKAAEQAGRCLMGGHFHEDFLVQYSANSDRLIWAATAGCLVDDSSLAFAYNNTNLKRPILGCMMVINGYPQLVPMILEKGGKWAGWIP